MVDLLIILSILYPSSTKVSSISRQSYW